MQKIFLDTNIIIDFLGERENFYLPSARILTLADQNKIKVYASAVSISTTYYLLSKYENQNAAIEKIRKFKVLCSISVMDDEVVEKAMNSDLPDFEDALQYYSALASGCELFITRNEKDFKNAMLPVMNAESYLKSI